ncbi:MAG: dihydrodipicolinate synthase family protein, partial [bacterium]|nr:dihydrodipicolinate synthase family protein [bacterium]
MTELSTTQPTRGIVPPIVTPLLDSDTLDLEGLKRLVEHLIEGGVAGIFILGSTGEAANISHRLRSELMKATCEFVAGRVPVWVGVTDPSTVETLNLANVAAKAG